MASGGAVELATHVVIPDTQIEPGDPDDFCTWVGRYIVDQFAGKPNIKIKHLGDHAAMNSLSVHNTPEEAEGRAYGDDIAAANTAWAKLNAPLERYNKRREPSKQWWPQRDILLGNHENHIPRKVGQDPSLRGSMSLDDLDYERSGWTVHPFLDVHTDDGIAYSHYFQNSGNSRPIGGMIETRIKTLGCSFVQGHQQGLKAGMVETIAGRRRGIVAGSCYLKNEGYRGQNVGEWRGILVLHEVHDGDFDLMEVSLSYLCRKYESVSIAEFMADRYGLPWAA